MVVEVVAPDNEKRDQLLAAAEEASRRLGLMPEFRNREPANDLMTMALVINGNAHSTRGIPKISQIERWMLDEEPEVEELLD